MTRPILKLAKRLWNGAINEIGILSATTGQKEWRRGRVASSTNGENHGSFPLKSMSGITFPLWIYVAGKLAGNVQVLRSWKHPERLPKVSRTDRQIDDFRQSPGFLEVHK